MAQLNSENSSVLPEVLVASTTGGGNSAEFTIPEGGHATVFVKGLAGIETVNIQLKLADGTWVAALDGSFPLTATVNASAIWAKGVFRVVQDATAGATTTQAYGISFKRKGY